MEIPYPKNLSGCAIISIFVLFPIPVHLNVVKVKKKYCDVFGKVRISGGQEPMRTRPGTDASNITPI